MVIGGSERPSLAVMRNLSESSTPESSTPESSSFQAMPGVVSLVLHILTQYRHEQIGVVAWVAECQ